MAGHQLARDMILHWSYGDYLLRKKPMQPALVGKRLARWAHALSILKNGFDGQEMARISASFTQTRIGWMRTATQISDDGIERLHAHWV